MKDIARPLMYYALRCTRGKWKTLLASRACNKAPWKCLVFYLII